MELKQYFRLFKRWIWLLILGIILGSVGAGVASIYQVPVYSSSAIIFISQPNRNELSELGYLSGQQLIETYSQLMLTDKILDATSEFVGYTISSSQINIQQIRNTQLLHITIEAEDPEKAAEFTNTLVKIFATDQYITQTSRFAESKASLEEAIEKQTTIIEKSSLQLEKFTDLEVYSAEQSRLEFTLLQAQNSYTNYVQSYEALKLAEAQSSPLIELSEEAKPNSEPVRPNIINNVLLGGVVGLMLAGGTVFLIEYLDDSVRTPEEIVEKFGVAPIGFIGTIPSKSAERIIYVDQNPRSPIAEAFRSLRTNIEFANASHPLKTILITSLNPSEGKTLIGANLASVIAQEGKTVALVDCDMRRPRAHKQFNIKNRLGLSEYFRGYAKVPDIIRRINDNLYIATTGKLPPNPADMLGSEKITKFFQGMKNLVSTVIVDSPPTIVTDPFILSSKVDGVILVVVLGKTKLAALQTALEQFERAGARIVGVVFNQFNNKESQYYDTYMSYEYYQNEENLEETQQSRIKKTSRGNMDYIGTRK